MRSPGLLASIPVIPLLACFQPESNSDAGGSNSSDSTETNATASTSADDPSASTSGPPSTSNADSNGTQDTSGSADASATGPDATGGPDCADGEMACGDTCVDLDVDAGHCGACDHDCLGGECTEGACAAVELASGKGRLFMVHVNADHIYYGGDGVDVWRMNKDGSDDTLIATDENAYDSALTDTHLLWGNDWEMTTTGVRGCEVPDCPGDAVQLVPGTNLRAMTYNAANSTLYFDQGTDIMAKIWPAGSQTVFAGGQMSPYEITNDGAFVYWNYGSDVRGWGIRKQAVMNGSPAALVTGRTESASDVAVGATALYWGEYDGSGNVLSAPLPNGIGGGAPTVLGTVGGDIYAIAVDDEHVYWVAQGGGGGSVQRCPIAGCGGAPEILSTDPEPWEITLDDVALYCVTQEGSVWKIAK